MTIRHSVSSILRTLAFALVASPLLSQAQAPAAAPADASSTNAAPAASTPPPAAPAPAVVPAPAAPADTNAPAATTPTERPTTYTMVKGDSLDSIAKKFDTSIHALAKLNHIPKSMYRKLRAGKVLQIPLATSDTTTK
jgi:5'-nucleotidase / UDP-sugar diphosphatase